MTGLVLGSLVPDAEAFLRMYSRKDVTHSWNGFLLFGIPLGILVSFMFHNLVRNCLINHLPPFVYQRFARFSEFDWNLRFKTGWYVVIISLFIGGATHFFWDSFSHFNGWLFQMYPALKGDIFYGEKQLEIPFLIQYISTLLGVFIILSYILLLPRSSGKPPLRTAFLFWTLITALTAVIFFTRLKLIEANMPDDLMIGLISSFTLAVLFVCIFWPRLVNTRILRRSSEK